MDVHLWKKIGFVNLKNIIFIVWRSDLRTHGFFYCCSQYDFDTVTSRWRHARITNFTVTGLPREWWQTALIGFMTNLNPRKADKKKIKIITAGTIAVNSLVRSKSGKRETVVWNSWKDYGTIVRTICTRSFAFTT